MDGGLPEALTKDHLRVHVERVCNITMYQDGQCTYKRNNGASSRNNCCRGKATSITYSECVCGLSYPVWKAHAPYYIVSTSLSGSAIFFLTLSHKRHNFSKKKKKTTEHKIVF